MRPAAVGLSPSSPVRDIDPRVAGRRVGLKEKGPPAFEVLEEHGIATVRQLLHHYPRRYIDRTTVVPIRALRPGQEATVIAGVRGVRRRMTRRRQSMVTVTLYDRTGTIDITFFNQPWTERIYREGMELAVSGTVQVYARRLQLAKPEVEILRAEAEQVHTGRITPVHPATEGITTRTIRELVFRALERIPELPDPLPREVVGPEDLASHDWAVRRIHFPEDDGELTRARERLKFDELFTLELGVAFRKHRVEAGTSGVAHEPAGPLAGGFAGSLPFELTTGQRGAMAEIAEAMARPRPMNLLLQGDVGSGKTVVALHAAMVAVQSGHQAAIMAPTEVLAGQHHRKVRELLEPLGARPFLDVPGATGSPPEQPSLLDAGEPDRAEPPLTFALLTAQVTGKDRRRVLEGVESGEVDLLVGTHALVQEAVTFRDLSLAVIDEQHRFGVHQRIALKGKGAAGAPDVLIMTATPIPRTLALTYYGDLDVAVLDELPAGRQPIETRVARTALERNAAYDLVRREVQAGRQAYVVCAAIDEENRLEVRAAEKEADRLATEVFPDLRVAVLHGRMRPADKDSRMEEFRGGLVDVLISTTVIEVGVDVPNATVMLVENAERFGLAQLHQLRGRIGRGAHRSSCILCDEAGPENEVARERLAAMVRTTDGFELADDDLRLRGEGTLFDVKQSGMPDLKLARLAEDLELVKRARAR
ncbi:MAG: ATP-dependent DNA helicase RecG, partial [Actinobacteria bacterium]|nr:ATP-dependent DNA helicase RecG [Actinomycetota bacterium]